VPLAFVELLETKGTRVLLLLLLLLLDSVLGGAQPLFLFAQHHSFLGSDHFTFQMAYSFKQLNASLFFVVLRIEVAVEVVASSVAVEVVDSSVAVEVVASSLVSAGPVVMMCSSCLPCPQKGSLWPSDAEDVFLWLSDVDEASPAEVFAASWAHPFLWCLQHQSWCS